MNKFIKLNNYDTEEYSEGKVTVFVRTDDIKKIILDEDGETCYLYSEHDNDDEDWNRYWIGQTTLSELRNAGLLPAISEEDAGRENPDDFEGKNIESGNGRARHH